MNENSIELSEAPNKQSPTSPRSPFRPDLGELDFSKIEKSEEESKRDIVLQQNYKSGIFKKSAVSPSLDISANNEVQIMAQLTSLKS